MPNLNYCMLCGHLTADPDLRRTPSGHSVCEIVLAVNRRMKDRDETLFLPCTVWGKPAENVARYLRKGSGVMVQGFLRQENWQAQDGSRRTSIKLVAEEVQFTDIPNRVRQQNDQRTAPPPSSGPVAPEYGPAETPSGGDDDIPF